jgi:hypothetical protein
LPRSSRATFRCSVHGDDSGPVNPIASVTKSAGNTVRCPKWSEPTVDELDVDQLRPVTRPCSPTNLVVETEYTRSPFSSCALDTR